MKNLIFFALFVISINFEVAKSLTINCNFQTQTFSVIKKVYACSASNIEASSSQTVTAVTGVHMIEKTNNDVDAIIIEGNWTLSEFPKSFSKFFSNIKAITIRRIAFETLFGDEFDEFPQLQFLDISYSNLTTISSKFFEKTPKLIVISFAFTNLQRVGFELFKPLNMAQLIWVGFPFNLCIDRSITDGNLAAINSLIDELKTKCAFDNEEFLTSSTVADLTTTTTEEEELTTASTAAATTENLTTKMPTTTITEEATSTTAITTEENLTTEQETTTTSTTEENLTCSEKNVKELICEIKEEIHSIYVGMQEIKDELLRISANPCAC